MKCRVQFNSEAADTLKELDKVVAQRIFSKIHWLAENFEQIIPERLSGELKEFYKLRIGDWRVIYTFHHGIIVFT